MNAPFAWNAMKAAVALDILCGEINALTTSKLLPLILRQLQLRRAMSDSMTVRGKEVVIGQGIPLYEIVTVELRMNQAQKEF